MRRRVVKVLVLAALFTLALLTGMLLPPAWVVSHRTQVWYEEGRP